jgi:hypothetical protein
VGEPQGGFGLLGIQLRGARIPVIGDVRGKQSRARLQFGEGGIDEGALINEFCQVVSPTEGLIMPGEEALQSLFHSLLAVENDDIEQGWRLPRPCSCEEIMLCLLDPFPR